MELAYALPLILALGLAFFAVRRYARRRGLSRQKARRGRGERTGPRNFEPAKTKRSQMRTDDDPTTIIERITETKPPDLGPRSRPK
jgi:hypothetical protein